MKGDEKDPIRPSIISVMGHVDHGKTTLLDRLSNSNVAAYEPGKITQSLSAFTVNLSENGTDDSSIGRVTFMDTPGHEAFTNMRESSVMVSDFAVLVISALEGLKKQTFESLKIIRSFYIPAIVVINKIDVATEEQINKVYRQLHEAEFLSPDINHYNNIAMEKNYDLLFREVDEKYPIVAVVEISALTGENMDILRATIKELHQSMTDYLHCNLDVPAEATVIESISSKSMGKILLLMTHIGTLKKGSTFVVEQYMGTIKSMKIADMRYISSSSLDSKKMITSPLNQAPVYTPEVESVGPGLPVLVTGLQSEKFPIPGSTFFQLPRERAIEVSQYRSLFMEYKIREITDTLYKPERVKKEEKGEEEEDEEEEIEEIDEEEEKKLREEDMKRSIFAIIKADNQGRLDTILRVANESTKKMGYDLKILSQGVGDVNPNDLFVAKIILEENEIDNIYLFCFQVGLDANAKNWMRSNTLAKNIVLKSYKIFTDMVDDIKEIIETKEKKLNK